MKKDKLHYQNNEENNYFKVNIDLKNLNMQKADYKFSELFDLKKIQEIQDMFSAATGVASIITEVDGTPITEPSNFSCFCGIVRKTEVGMKNCMFSDSVLGSPYKDGPRMQKCLSGGLWDGGAGIMLGDVHIANWLIGQVLESDYNEKEMLHYADKIGADRDQFQDALNKVTRMSRQQFSYICKFLFLIANQLSVLALKNIQQEDEIRKRKMAETETKKLNSELEKKVQERTVQLEKINADLEEVNSMLEEEISEKQKAEKEIKKLNEELEYKVIDRTNRLQEMNRLLEEEIFEKNKAEKALIAEKNLMEAVFNSIDEIIYLYDDQNKLIRWNKKHEELTGYTAEELYGMGITEWYMDNEISKEVLLRHISEMLKNGGYSAEASLRKKDGTGIPMYFKASTLSLEGRTHYVGIGIDITKRIEAEEILRKSEEKYRILTENTSDVISVLNLSQGKVTYISPSVYHLRGYTAEEAICQSLEEVMTPESYVLVKEKLEQYTGEFTNDPTKHNAYTLEIQQPCKNGQIIWVELSLKFRINSDGEIETVCVSRNIEERKKAQSEIIYLSYHDQLTGLYNRRFYEEELKRLDVKTNLPLTVVMGDVNGLKLINDSFGHAKGDELLVKVAEVLRRGCRKSDCIARLGGDEFVILMQKTNASDAEQIIRRINQLASSENVGSADISVSFGWETKYLEEEKIETVLKIAEDSMYKKKLFESPSMRGKTIKAIISTLHEKNKREEEHSRRVALFCESMGKAMGLLEKEIDELRTMGLLHDIGKIAIDDNILSKPGKLNDEEWEQIKRHPEIGYRILSTLNDMSDIAKYTLFHHERLNGSGYPKGLKGDEIPLPSRILSIADAYDAMTCERSYRGAMPEADAIHELEKCSGMQFDEALVRIFIENVLKKEWDK